MEDLRLFLFSAPHHILNGPQERHAIAGGFLFADAGDVQKLIHAQGLALDHLAEGRVAEHHVGRNILLRCKTLAEGVERGQQLLVGLAEVAVAFELNYKEALYLGSGDRTVSSMVSQ